MKTFFKVIYALRYYLLCILIAVLILIGLDLWLVPKVFPDTPWWLIVLFIVGSVVAVILIDGIIAAVVHKFPKKWFDPYKKKYKLKKGEKKFFDIIKIRKWKDKIPEIGALTCDFGKGKIDDPNNPAYLYDFLIEMGYAESIHFSSCLLGFLIILIIPLKYFYFIGIPIGIVNIGFNILSAWIQRFNRPKLLILYERKMRNKNESVKNSI